MKIYPLLVTRATGQQGGTVARHLFKNGFPVKALTRSPSSSPAAEKLKGMSAILIQGDREEAVQQMKWNREGS